MQTLADDAEAIVRGSEDDEVELDADVLGFHVSRPVELVVGELESVRVPVEVLTLSIAVHAVDHPGLFPVMEGEIEVVGLSTGVELALEAEYRVPSGLLGLALDAAALHGIAHSSIDHLFAGLSNRLEKAGRAYDALSGIPV